MKYPETKLTAKQWWLIVAIVVGAFVLAAVSLYLVGFIFMASARPHFEF